MAVPIPPDLKTNPVEIAEALTAVLQSEGRLLGQSKLQLDILHRIAATLDALTAWLQTPPSSDVPDLLRAIVAKLDALDTKADDAGRKVDFLITLVNQLAARPH